MLILLGNWTGMVPIIDDTDTRYGLMLSGPKKRGIEEGRGGGGSGGGNFTGWRRQ